VRRRRAVAVRRDDDASRAPRGGGAAARRAPHDDDEYDDIDVDGDDPEAAKRADDKPVSSLGWGDTRKHRTAVATATVLPTGANGGDGGDEEEDEFALPPVDDGAEHAGDELVFEVISNIINVSCR